MSEKGLEKEKARPIKDVFGIRKVLHFHFQISKGSLLASSDPNINYLFTMTSRNYRNRGR